MATNRGRLRWRRLGLSSDGDDSRAVIDTPLGRIRIRADQRNALGRHVVTIDFQPNEGVVLDGFVHSKMVGMPDAVNTALDSIVPAEA